MLPSPPLSPTLKKKITFTLHYAASNYQQLKHVCLLKALAILDTIIPDSEYDKCNLGLTSHINMKAWKEKGCQDTEYSSRKKAAEQKCKRRRSDAVCLGAGKCFESNSTKTESVCKTCFR